ncbi:MAG: universal stress protein [Rhodothermales bacterium]
MRSIRKILVPTDLSHPAHEAFRLGVDLAEHYDAEVDLLHVTPRGGSEPIRAFFHRLLQDAGASDALREELTERVETHHMGSDAPRRRIKRVHREGADVASEVLTYATAEDIDLIVMGTHGHRSLDHPALGGTAGEVVRGADCAVLTVRQTKKRDDGAAAPIQHLLVPVDFSEHADGAVAAAKELAARYRAALSLLFVVEERQVPLFSDTGIPAITTLKMDPEAGRRAEAALAQLFENAGGPDPASSAGQAVQAAYHVRHGHPGREVLAFAESSDVDLIVMSPHGLSGRDAFSLGSVTENVVRLAPCPVLTLKGF